MNIQYNAISWISHLYFEKFYYAVVFLFHIIYPEIHVYKNTLKVWLFLRIYSFI